MEENQSVFIIDVYSPHLPQSVQEMVRFKFKINDNWYCILEVPLEWGQVKMERPIDEEYTPEFYYFKSFEAAMMYVRRMRRINNGW